MINKVKWLINRINMEMTAYRIIAIWCLLPISMSIYCVLTALTNRFLPMQYGDRFVISIDCLIALTTAYHFIFLILGLLSLLFCIYISATFCKTCTCAELIKSRPWSCLLLALLIWSIISTCLSDDIWHSIKGSRYCFTGLESYFVFAAICLISSSIKSDKHIKDITVLFCLVLTILSMIVIIQAYTESFLDMAFTFDYASVFIHHNHFGYLLCMGIIGYTGLYMFDTAANKLSKGLYLFGQATLVFALLLNTTFGSYIASILGLALLYSMYFLRHANQKHDLRIFLPILVFIIVSMCDYFIELPIEEHFRDRFATLFSGISQVANGSSIETTAGMERTHLWSQTIQRIAQRPLFGFGPDGFTGENAITWSDNVTQDLPHNEFLQMAAYTGIPSLIIYVSSLILLMHSIYKRLQSISPYILVTISVVITYMMSSVFGNPMFNTAPFLWLFLGLSSSVQTSDNNDCNSERENRDSIEKCNLNRFKGFIRSVVACIVAALIAYTYSVFHTKEYNGEFADLQAMRNAELGCTLAIQKGIINESGDYWYDANNYRLIPLSESSPNPYGLGTELNADADEAFYEKFELRYQYDGRRDYTNSVIIVHIKNKNDELTVGMEWADLHG